MSTEVNKAAERRLIEEMWNKHNPGAVDEFIAPDLIEHNPILGIGPGRDGFRKALELIFATFPDLHIILEDVIGEGDKVITRWTGRTTHVREFMGIPPTNKQLVIEGIDIFRYANGKRAESWHQWDQLGMMQQLGAVPPRRQPG